MWNRPEPLHRRAEGRAATTTRRKQGKNSARGVLVVTGQRLLFVQERGFGTATQRPRGSSGGSDSHLSHSFASAGSASVVSAADEIKKLAELRDAGILTEEEFAAKKTQLLGL